MRILYAIDSWAGDSWVRIVAACVAFYVVGASIGFGAYVVIGHLV